MKVSVITDTGLIRERNEDSYLVDTSRGLFAVCDGMGGHRGGDVASRTAVQAIKAHVLNTSTGNPIEVLTEAIQKANHAVWTAAQMDAEIRDMGTTATVALVTGRQLYAAHVGDSGLYLIRNSNIHKITRDHTLAEQMVSTRVMTEEEARSSAYNHILTRAVGINVEVDIDCYQEELTSGDIILLCSDGLSDMVELQDINAIVKRHGEQIGKAAQEMLQAALHNGGYDNITLILLLIQ